MAQPFDFNALNERIAQRRKERQDKAIPVEHGGTIMVVGGNYAGDVFTVDELLEAWEDADTYIPDEPDPPETIVTRHAECRECHFTARDGVVSVHGYGPEDPGAMDFRVWNHEHQTGHRVDVRTEVDRGI